MQQKLTSMRMYPHLQLLSGRRLLVTYSAVMLKEESSPYCTGVHRHRVPLVHLVRSSRFHPPSTDSSRCQAADTANASDLCAHQDSCVITVL